MERRRVGLIDLETKELLQEIRPKTKQQLLYGAKKNAIREYRSNGGRNFIACFPQELRKINHEITLIEAGAAMRLLGYLRWNENGRLIDKGKSLTVKDLSKIFGKGLTATKDILKRLESFDLVGRARDGKSNAFFINPRFFQFGGGTKTKDYTKLFIVKSRNLVEELSIQEAGLLWKVIPYFHFATYYLCENYTEKDAQIIRHMSRETLASHIGHDRKTVGKLMSGLNKKGAVLITQANGSRRYLINPDLIYRKILDKDVYTRSVRELFKQHEELINKER